MELAQVLSLRKPRLNQRKEEISWRAKSKVRRERKMSARASKNEPTNSANWGTTEEAEKPTKKEKKEEEGVTKGRGRPKKQTE